MRYNKKRPYEALLNALQRNCNWDGRKRVGITCLLTYEEFLAFIAEGRCHYCWVPLVWVPHNLHKVGGAKYQLDRKDHSKDYCVSNCVTCCTRCNRAKSNSFTYEEWWQMTAIYRRTEQMKIGEVLVHKSLGNQPLVVTGVNEHEVGVRFGTQGPQGVYFISEVFNLEELETPVESIKREAEIFKALNIEKEKINSSMNQSSTGISHLN